MENHQRVYLLLLLENFPMRIGLSRVRSQAYVSISFSNHDRKMRRKRAVIGIGNQNRERVRAHEGESSLAIFDTIELWDVHYRSVHMKLRLLNRVLANIRSP